MKHRAALTISRPSYGTGEKKISITVKDKDAGIRFLEIEIDYDTFAEALTGLSESDCMMTVRGLENVGKNIERKEFKFKMPDCGYHNVKDVAAQEAEKLAPEGWKVSTYFGSKDSFFEKDGERHAKTTISRWVKKEK